MGVLVDMTTGKIVKTGDIGNLCEYVNALNECGIEHNYRIFLEDDVYAEVA